MDNIPLCNLNILPQVIVLETGNLIGKLGVSNNKYLTQ